MNICKKVFSIKNSRPQKEAPFLLLIYPNSIALVNGVWGPRAYYTQTRKKCFLTKAPAPIAYFVLNEISDKVVEAKKGDIINLTPRKITPKFISGEYWNVGIKNIYQATSLACIPSNGVDVLIFYYSSILMLRDVSWEFIYSHVADIRIDGELPLLTYQAPEAFFESMICDIRYQGFIDISGSLTKLINPELPFPLPTDDLPF